MNLLSQLLFCSPLPPPEKASDGWGEWQRRSDAYGTVKPKVLKTLEQYGRCTPEFISGNINIEINSVRRALRGLAKLGLAEAVEPAKCGKFRQSAIWIAK